MAAAAAPATPKAFRKGVVHLESALLAVQYPPQMKSGNKKFLLTLSCPPGKTTHAGTLKVARWGAVPVPKNFAVAKACAHSHREDGYGYERNNDAKGKTEFYVNFADKHLFGYYGGPLFAQDEMQANEHPILCSLREYLISKQNTDVNVRPFTTDVDGGPTPIIVMNAERRVAVATNPDKDAGRPKGLYGNSFAVASPEAIFAATTVISPPTITNLIAMEAPKYGSGEYRISEITNILTIAYSSFVAARAEAVESWNATYGKAAAAAAAQDQKAAGAAAGAAGAAAGGGAAAAASGDDSKKAAAAATGPAVIIHTGNWGTGAYGGNKVLMALLQIAAAHLSQVDGLVYHTFAKEFTAAYLQALQIFTTLLKADAALDTTQFIHKVHALKLKWGQSDGT